jgi:hypothetical protein
VNEQKAPVATSRDFYEDFNTRHPAIAVTLPKLGKTVLLRRPSPLWFIFHDELPATLAASVAGGDPHDGAGPEKQSMSATSRWVLELLMHVMVQPRVSLHPEANEISPELIADEDVNFIIKWAYGEVAPDGSDLATFR